MGLAGWPGRGGDSRNHSRLLARGLSLRRLRRVPRHESAALSQPVSAAARLLRLFTRPAPAPPHWAMPDRCPLPSAPPAAPPAAASVAWRAALPALALASLLALHGLPAQAAPAAPAADGPSQALLRAAMVIKTFDHFAAACQAGRGFSPAEARQVATWEAAQQLPALRQHLQAHPLPARQAMSLDEALARLLALPQLRNAHPCAAAVATTRAPDAQIGAALAEVAAAPASAPTATAPTITATPATTPSAAPDSVQLLAEIDSFGFNTRPKMGLGGFIALDIYPVVLFKDGAALTEVKRLAEGGSAATLQQRHAADFTRWRRSGGELQLRDENGGWKALPFQTRYASLPEGLRLDGLYRSTAGSGNLAVGGSQAVTAWDDFRFMPDGQVTRGGGAGAQGAAGNTAVSTSSSRAARTGSYRIDGLSLHIRYPDGSSERHILIADPQDTRRTIWINGVGYVRRER